MCTLVQIKKRARMPTLGSAIPWSTAKPCRVNSVDKTPTTCRRLTTPYHAVPTRTTFCNPHPYSPLSPQASVQLLASLELVAMEGEEPPSAHSLAFSTSSQEARSDMSAPASPSTASTVSCSTEGSCCFTP